LYYQELFFFFFEDEPANIGSPSSPPTMDNFTIDNELEPKEAELLMEIYTNSDNIKMDELPNNN